MRKVDLCVWRDIPDETGERGELALIQKAAQGDHEAFRAIVILYEGQLLGYLTQMLDGDRDSAHDIAQETFLAVFQQLPRWQPPISREEPLADAQSASSLAGRTLLSPWLYRIATNRAISLIRKQGVRRKVQSYSHDHLVSLQNTKTREAADLPVQPSFEEQSIARELLRSALSTLAEDDAACLVLHYVSGERYGEIATRLGISNEAARKRVSRALAALRKAYAVLDMEVR